MEHLEITQCLNAMQKILDDRHHETHCRQLEVHEIKFQNEIKSIAKDLGELNSDIKSAQIEMKEKAKGNSKDIKRIEQSIADSFNALGIRLDNASKEYATIYARQAELKLLLETEVDKIRVKFRWITGIITTITAGAMWFIGVIK